MATYSNPRTNAMGQGALALVIDTRRKITQSHASSDSSNASAIDSNGLKGFKANDHAAILTTGAEGGTVSQQILSFVLLDFSKI